MSAHTAHDAAQRRALSLISSPTAGRSPAATTPRTLERVTAPTRCFTAPVAAARSRGDRSKPRSRRAPAASPEPTAPVASRQTRDLSGKIQCREARETHDTPLRHGAIRVLGVRGSAAAHDTGASVSATGVRYASERHPPCAQVTKKTDHRQRRSIHRVPCAKVENHRLPRMRSDPQTPENKSRSPERASAPRHAFREHRRKSAAAARERAQSRDPARVHRM